MTRRSLIEIWSGTGSRNPVTGPPITPGGHVPGSITQRGNFLTLAEKQSPTTLAHSLGTGWADLQPTAGATATGTLWTQLATSIGSAHTLGIKLILRIFCGVDDAPLWIYTHATKPVPWIDALDTKSTRTLHVGTAPAFDRTAPNYNETTGANKQGNYPYYIVWDKDVSSSPTDTQIKTAVNASNIRFHWNGFMNNVLAPFLAAPCDTDPSHPRSTHILCVPAVYPSVFGSEMTTSNKNKANGYTLDSTEGYRTSMLANPTGIRSSPQLATAYQQAWYAAASDMAASLPSNIFINVMLGTVFDSQQVMLNLVRAFASDGTGRMCVGRTDLRESYFDGAGATGAFGGGDASPTSPISALKLARDLGVPYCIQTAGDASGVGVAGFFDWTAVGGAKRAGTVQNAMVVWQRLISRLPYPVFCETSLSWDDPFVSGQTGVFNGERMSTTAYAGDGPFAGAGWPGGTVNLREYMSSATGNLQSQIA